jgi:uroporphyrinogen-III synthase
MSRTGELDYETSLVGRTVAFLEARRSAEIARLVEMHGGTPLVAPALRETPVEDPAPLDAWLAELAGGALQVVLFLTGVGCDALLQRARSEGQIDAILQGLARTRVIARGPKPLRVLKQHNVRVDFVPPEPNTSDELLAELASWELRGKRLGLQVYGGTTPFLERLREGLDSLGAFVHEVAPYRWEGPADHSGVLGLIDACVAGSVDALAIFSSSQIHNLFAIADEHGRAAELQAALNNPRLIVASVGPVASEAIESHDVHVDLQPEHPKMGHLIMALGDAFAGRPPRAEERKP